MNKLEKTTFCFFYSYCFLTKKKKNKKTKKTGQEKKIFCCDVIILVN